MKQTEIPRITKRPIFVGRGLNAITIRRIEGGRLIQVTPSYNQNWKGYKRRWFRTRKSALSYVGTLRRGTKRGRIKS